MHFYTIAIEIGISMIEYVCRIQEGGASGIRIDTLIDECKIRHPKKCIQDRLGQELVRCYACKGKISNLIMQEVLVFNTRQFS